MDVALLEQLRESERRNEELRQSQQEMLQELQALRRDHESLVDATRALVDERDAFRERVAELEATNNRLVDMLWDAGASVAASLLVSSI